MNIREAKEEIEHTLRAYHRKDAEGNYLFPRVHQRPILLIGPPGIGKTAIMEQIAKECQVGLVAYTITHHTRQSAVGLPQIKEKRYGDTVYSITEYTMSEIIASVYDCMERTGKKEGILFIDEINCVSETLAPTMLQFLQNKRFGTHAVPEGWMIVAAGNPPEYNKSVREFDIVTLDRVRTIEVEADPDIWMDYAAQKNVHGAILSYLTVRKEEFYFARKKADVSVFVTARGWEDLSEILKSYEELDVTADEKLIRQYLQREETARSFAAYYRLYRTYGTDYGIAEILNGTLRPEDDVSEKEQNRKGSVHAYKQKVEMAKSASFDERAAVIGLLLDGLGISFEGYTQADQQAVRLHELLQGFGRYRKTDDHTHSRFSDYLMELSAQLKVKEDVALLDEGQLRLEKRALHVLEEYGIRLREEHLSDGETEYHRLQSYFSEEIGKRSRWIERLKAQLSCAFRFACDCFGENQEILLLVTGLTRNPRALDFIRMHGCPEYMKCSRMLLAEEDEILRKECSVLLEKHE